MVLYNESDQRPGTLTSQIFVTYIVYAALMQIVTCIISFIWIKNIRSEVKEWLIDLHKIVQYMFLLLFVVIRWIFIYLLLINNFEFYYAICLAFSTSFFYFFEVINDACWIDFIFHIKVWKHPSDMDENKLKSLNRKEKVILCFVFLIVIPWFLAIFTIIITGAAWNWNSYKAFNPEKNIMDNSTWNTLFNFGNILNRIMFYIGVFAIVLKIFIGIYLLKLMKKKVYGGYKKKWKGIIATIILTIIAEAVFTALNHIGDQDFSIYYIYMVTRRDDDTKTVVTRMILSMISTGAEILLIWFNTSIINFKYYILMLMVGRRKINMIPRVTLFKLFIDSEINIFLKLAFSESI